MGGRGGRDCNGHEGCYVGYMGVTYWELAIILFALTSKYLAYSGRVL